MTRWTGSSWCARDVLGVLALGMLLVAALVAPRSDARAVTILGQSVPSTCMFRLLTGRPCPSCGLTRGVCFAVRGDVGHALSMHPMAPVVALAAVGQAGFMILSLAVPSIRRLKVPEWEATKAYGILMLVIFLAGTIRIFGLLPWPPS